MMSGFAPSPFRKRRRGTTRIESLAFLTLFCLAALVAWALWREPIRETNRKFIERARSLLP